MRWSFYLGFFMLLGCHPDKPDPKNVTVKTRSEVAAYSISGTPLYANVRSPETAVKQMQALAEAQENYDQDTSNIDFIIWLGRRTAYLQRYQQAIDIFTRGLEMYPNSARLYRHRGHRYITIRKFDLAIADFIKAADFIKDSALQIEPDGIPNKVNIPLSNTQFNIYYHWGLAHYLRREYALSTAAYEQCLKHCNNDDLITATIDWMYMALKRDGRDSAAVNLLSRISLNMNVIENDSYYQRLMMYKGFVHPDSLLQYKGDADPDMKYLALATQGYGVANWFYSQGDSLQSKEILNQVLATDSWAAFGYIAAEVDLYYWP